MLKKLLTLVLAIFILTTLPVVSSAEHSETVLNDTFIITQMKFMADNDYVLDNVTNEVVKVRLEVTNLCPGTKNTVSVIAVSKHKTNKSISKIDLAKQSFEIGDIKKEIDIPFDLSSLDNELNDNEILFYLWQNGSIIPLSRNSSSNFSNNILYDNYNVYEAGGYVTANYITSMDCLINEVQVCCDAINNSPFSSEQNVIFNIGNTNINDYIGKYCYVYFNQSSNGEYEIKSFIEDKKKSKVIKILAEQLDDNYLVFEGDSPCVKYFKNEDTASTAIELNPQYISIWNNCLIENSYLTSNLNSTANFNVEFIDINNDNIYDIVKAYEYIHLIAQGVNTNTNKIMTYNDFNVAIDYDADVNIEDINGNKLSLSDINDKDVLAITVSREDTLNPSLNLLKTALYDSIDIIVLKNRYVEGKITYVADELKANNDLVFHIDNTEYKFCTEDEGCYGLFGISPDNGGLFFIGINGKIIGFEEALEDNIDTPDVEDSADASLSIAIVESCTPDQNSPTTTNVLAYKNEEKFELIFDANNYTELYSETNPENFSFGTVLIYEADDNGIVSKYSVVGTTSIGSTKDFTFNAEFKENFDADYKNGKAFYYGWISEKTADDDTLVVMVTDCICNKTIDEFGEMFKVANANQYTITGTSANPFITTGTYTDGNVDAYDYDFDKAWFVLVKTYKDEVIDIISFDDKGKAPPIIEEEYPEDEEY